MQQSGIRLWLAGLNPEPLQLIQKSELGKTLGRPRMYFTLDQAVRSFLKQSADVRYPGKDLDPSAQDKRTESC